MRFSVIVLLVNAGFGSCSKSDTMRTIESFNVIGISVETTNRDNQAAEDLGKLWTQFYQEGITERIPYRMNETVYSIYTNYESDYKGRYTTIIGMQVESLDSIPEGMVGIVIPSARYREILAKGKMPDAVVDAWMKIWEQDETLNRAYTVDFEVYGPKSQMGDDSEVQIFLATK